MTRKPYCKQRSTFEGRDTRELKSTVRVYARIQRKRPHLRRPRYITRTWGGRLKYVRMPYAAPLLQNGRKP